MKGFKLVGLLMFMCNILTKTQKIAADPVLVMEAAENLEKKILKQTREDLELTSEEGNLFYDKINIFRSR